MSRIFCLIEKEEVICSIVASMILIRIELFRILHNMLDFKEC